MDLFQLETFLAVSREGGFSRAAKKLFRTQPAVSQTVRKLEAELGETLFDRSSREGTLTDAGQVLLAYAEHLLNLRGEARIALEELRQMHQGKLSIAANEYTCLYLLPLLDQYRRLYPAVKITVQRALASRIPAEVLSHNAELAVLSFRPQDQALRSVVVYRDALAFVVPPHHPLASARRISIRQLAAEYFVAHNVPSPYRRRVLETFQRRRVPLHMPVELPTIEAIKKFVGAGNGVALIPRLCVESELRRGELVHIQVPELNFERRLRLVYRAHGSLSHAARAFLKVCHSRAERHGESQLYHLER
ncbi:MAG TPA: LysR family transcriptional regulator [Candidatus Eisenbacteria bacterium]|jgi:DNA-binding transcriptional LysR family regulator|nr:LysR family transcriptional regulator [Candidatus Eisenbacteria bacterium]